MKKYLNIAAIISLTLLGLYLAGWLFLSIKINNKIDEIYAKAPDKNIEFLGEKPSVTGFPGIPKIIYKKGIKKDKTQITFPVFILEGYLIPWTTITASFPEGMKILGPYDVKLSSFDYFSSDVLVPTALPEEPYEEDLRLWQQQNGQIAFENLIVQKESLSITGNGIFSLDQNLQPIFDIQTVLTGYQDFLVYLQKQRLIDTLPAIAATAMLNSLATLNPETGQSQVSVRVFLQDQWINFGSVRLAPLPTLHWDKRNQPDPHQ